MNLILYSTDYCQLCDEALALVEQTLEGRGYQLRVVDISESDELMVKYASTIPVLKRLDCEDSEKNELNWPFTAAQILRFKG